MTRRGSGNAELRSCRHRAESFSLASTTRADRFDAWPSESRLTLALQSP